MNHAVSDGISFVKDGVIVLEILRFCCRQLSTCGVYLNEFENSSLTLFLQLFVPAEICMIVMYSVV